MNKKQNPWRLVRGQGGGIACLARHGREWYCELSRRSAAARTAKAAARRSAGAPSAPRWVKIGVALRADQAAQLDKTARRFGLSRAAILREAVDLWLLDLEQG